MVLATSNLSSPWSTVGNNVGEVSSMHDAMVKAGVDYNIVKEPMHRIDGSIIDNHFGVMREDTGRVFDMVKNSWKPLQNVDCFKFFDPMLEEGLIKLESIGSIGGGERMFIVAKINEPPMTITGSDTISKYMLLLNSHNKKSSIRVGFMPVRFSCTNQIAAIMRNKQSQILRIRHCQSPKDSLDSLREVLNIANAEFVATQEKLQFLASKPFHYPDLLKYIKVVMDMPEDEEEMSTRAKNVVEKIAYLSEYGRGNNVDGVRHTWYAAMNGVTEYINYYAGRSVDTRLNSLWTGTNSIINDKSLRIALEMAG